MTEAKDDNAKAQRGALPDDPEADAGKPHEVTNDQSAALRFKRISTAGIFQKMPAHTWICEYLGWTPGRPAMVQGYSYSGKSIIVQSAVLHLAAGRKLWARNSIGGIGSIAPAIRVLHVDHEQGEYATRDRYQRLAAGMNLYAEDLEGRLDLVCFPELSLAHPRAEELYIEECKTPDAPEHVDLCVIDSLRATTPGIDENDSRMGDIMAKLSRISDKTRTAFVIIHHEGKSASGRQDARETGRGSSAIFAGAGSVVRVLGGTDKGDQRPRRLEMVKNAAESRRAEMQPFYLKFRNAEHEGDPDGALCVDFIEKDIGDAAWEEAPKVSGGQRAIPLTSERNGSSNGVKASRYGVDV